MNFIELSKHPDNAADYLKVMPSDAREAFIKNLAQLLTEGRPLICTDAVPFEWVANAISSIHPKGFYIGLVVRVAIDFGERGAAFAHFYFQKRGPNAY
jgi:hypothetical protein